MTEPAAARPAMTMLLLSAYRLRERAGFEHFRRTQFLGLVPLFLALMIMSGSRGGPAPGLVCALGLALGLELILWGAYNLHFTPEPLSRPARRLVAESDRWFPAVVFVTRHLLYTLTLVMLWLTLLGMGFPASWLLHVILLAILLLLPAKSLSDEAARLYTGPRQELAQEAVRSLLIMLVAIFTAATVTRFTLPPDQPLTGEVPPALVVVWVVAILICLACGILLADHALRGRKEKPARPAPASPAEF